MRITDRAADEAARLLTLRVDEARALLTTWIAGAMSRQQANANDNGTVEYRSPRPWRLEMIIDDDDVGGGRAMVAVRPSSDTRRVLAMSMSALNAVIESTRLQATAAASTAAPPAAHGGRRHGLSEPGTITPSTKVQLTDAQRAHVDTRAKARGVSVSEYIRTLVADDMESWERGE